MLLWEEGDLAIDSDGVSDDSRLKTHPSSQDNASNMIPKPSRAEFSDVKPGPTKNLLQLSFENVEVKASYNKHELQRRIFSKMYKNYYAGLKELDICLSCIQDNTEPEDDKTRSVLQKWRERLGDPVNK